VEPPKGWPWWAIAGFAFAVTVTLVVALGIYYVATHGFGD